MKFEDFKRHINSFVGKSKSNISVRFENDTDKGVYIARCSDGTRFFGNSGSLKLTVCWASHKAQVPVG